MNEMVKHYCDRCGKEIAGLGNYVFAEIRIRRGLPTGTYALELCKECVDKAFGVGFSDKCEAEYAEKKKAMEERKAARLAEKNKQEGA